MTTPTHITSSGGLISAAFLENIRELGPASVGLNPNRSSFLGPVVQGPGRPGRDHRHRLGAAQGTLGRSIR